MGLHVIRNEIGLQIECMLGGKILQCDKITDAYVKRGNFIRDSGDVTLLEYLYHDVVNRQFPSLQRWNNNTLLTCSSKDLSTWGHWYHP